MKALKIFCSILMLSTVLFNPSARADGVTDYTITVQNDATGVPGQTGVPVSITLSKAETDNGMNDIQSVQIYLDFDTSKITVDRIEKTVATIPPDWLVSYGPVLGNPNRLSISLLRTIPGSFLNANGGELVKIYLDVAAGASLGNIPLVLPDAAPFLAEINDLPGCALVDGTFGIVSPIVAPAITTHPQDATVTEGNTATFTVVATGSSPLTYQWKKDNQDITNATSSTYTTPATVLADSDSKFKVVVTNAAGNITSNEATLTVNATTNRAPVTVNDTASLLTGNVVLINVLANDYDPDGNDIDIAQVFNPVDQGATASIVNVNGIPKIEYTASSNMGLSDTFEYTITDGEADSNRATVTVSRSPWTIPRGPGMFSYPVFGTVMVEGEEVAIGTWVAAVRTDPVTSVQTCYGAAQYHLKEYRDPQSGEVIRTVKQYAMSIYGKTENDAEGFLSGEAISFKVRVSGNPNDINVIPMNSEGQPYVAEYPIIENFENGWYDGPLVNINLESGQTRSYTLKDGWNFISLGLQPANTSIPIAFSSILADLEYVSSDATFWDKGTGSGTLTDVDGLHSYFVLLDIPEGETRILDIEGIPIPLPKDFPLRAGWNNISYLYNSPRHSIFNPVDGNNTGMFGPLSQHIVWVMGHDDNWEDPNGNGEPFQHEPGKGLFVKAAPVGTDVVTFTYEN